MSLNFGGRAIGTNEEPYVILEAGINHNGDIGLARDMIRAAKAAGADAVKFQTFHADEFVGDPSLMFTYQSQGRTVTESMLEMFRRHEFSRDQWREIKACCDATGITFLSTPQNESDLRLLLDIGVSAIKVGSDDFNNLPLLRSYARASLPMILSCGMADLGEVHDALEVTGALAGRPVVLLLCTSQYPTPPEDANLLKLRTLRGAFPDLDLGFSDHTQGPTAAVAACALGACVFEKHFTMDRGLPGPDHWFSEDPEGATQWVQAIRTAKRMLGSATLVPTAAEREMRVLARRSITALADIPAGATLTDQNVGLRRPGTGLAPALIDSVLSRRARRALRQGEQISLTDFE